MTRPWAVSGSGAVRAGVGSCRDVCSEYGLAAADGTDDGLVGVVVGSSDGGVPSRIGEVDGSAPRDGAGDGLDDAPVTVGIGHGDVRGEDTPLHGMVERDLVGDLIGTGRCCEVVLRLCDESDGGRGKEADDDCEADEDPGPGRLP